MSDAASTRKPSPLEIMSAKFALFTLKVKETVAMKKKPAHPSACTHCTLELLADGKELEHFCKKCATRYDAGFAAGKASVVVVGKEVPTAVVPAVVAVVKEKEVVKPAVKDKDVVKEKDKVVEKEKPVVVVVEKPPVVAVESVHPITQVTPSSPPAPAPVVPAAVVAPVDAPPAV